MGLTKGTTRFSKSRLSARIIKQVNGDEDGAASFRHGFGNGPTGKFIDTFVKKRVAPVNSIDSMAGKILHWPLWDILHSVIGVIISHNKKIKKAEQVFKWASFLFLSL